MTRPRQNIRTFLWTIPILILCGLIVYFDSSLNTCYGLLHGFRDVFLLLLVFLLLAIFLGRQIYKVITQTENRRNRIWASLMVIGAAFIAFQGESTWRELRLGSSILSASIYPDQLDIGRIELIDNGKYYALYGHIDWSCAFTGNYKFNGDTLILFGEPFEKTDGILADEYVLTDTTLVPVKSVDAEMERTEIMKVEKKN